MAEDKYVCSLEAKYVKKAKEELFENPEDRLAAVQAFRDWINEQPHIRCPKTDTIFLLIFLRWAKWSQIRARERFEGFLALQSITPSVYGNMDTRAEVVTKLIREGWVTVLPTRDPSGCSIAIFRAEAMKLPIKFEDAIKVMSMTLNYLMRSETTQVNGMVNILDWSGINTTVLSKMMGIEATKIQKTWINKMPGRWKSFHFYRPGILFDTILIFFKSIMPKKLTTRFKTHDTMESIYEYVPMHCLPAEYLPDDYTGQNAGSLKQIRENYIAALQEQEFHDDLLYKSSSSFGVDDNKRQTNNNVTQHFRKLNID